MKKLILLICLAALPAFGQLRTNVTLLWDYRWPDVTNTEFRIYQTTNVSSPKPWLFYRAIPAGVTNADVAVMANQQFFYVTATNLIGESDPSNVASCPAPPRSDVTLRVK